MLESCSVNKDDDNAKENKSVTSGSNKYDHVYASPVTSSVSEITQTDLTNVLGIPKLPRTLSTSVLKVKYRSFFWEKFYEPRTSRSM